MPKQNNLCTAGQEIYNFSRPFLDNHYYIVSLFGLCLIVEKNFKEIMHFQNIWQIKVKRRNNMAIMLCHF